MSQMIEDRAVEAPAVVDLVGAIHGVLAASSEPLTLSKIRAQLPAPLRGITLEELTDCLQRQVAAKVLCQYPKYRSQQDRYWDRPMDVHIASLLRNALQETALALSELRRKLPAYALTQAEEVLRNLVSEGRLHRHPRLGKRGGDRFGAREPDPKEYLRPELAAVFRALEPLGFTEAQLRAGALELLHDDEWSPAREAPPPAPHIDAEIPAPVAEEPLAEELTAESAEADAPIE